MKRTGLIGTLFISICISAFTCTKNEPAKGPVSETITIQPGPSEGQDCLVAYRETDNDLYASSNHKPNPDFTAIRWTYDADGAGEGTNRSYLKFIVPEEIQGLDSIDIISAKLSLYGIDKGVAAPLGNSYYPGSPYEGFGENNALLKRVVEDWSDSLITWNNKPSTTDDDQVTIPPSTSRWNYDAVDLDVTNMVKAMIAENKPYGFCLQLENEQIYRAILFGSSEGEDAAKRPKLVIEFVRKN